MSHRLSSHQVPPDTSNVLAQSHPPPQPPAPAPAPAPLPPHASPAVTSSEQHGQWVVPDTPTSTASPSLRRHPSGNGRTMELPPLPQAPSASGGSFSPASRSVGVASILNPIHPDEPHPSRRRKASQLSSPRSSAHILPPLGFVGPQSHSVMGTAAPSSTNPMGSSGGERAPRKLLTPRSPSLHRAAGLNSIMPSSAPMFAGHQTQFLGSPRTRSYAVEPGVGGVPPLPTPPAAPRQQYGLSAQTPPAQASAAPRTVSGTAGHGYRPPSESGSPRSSYSSYSRSGHASPSGRYATTSIPTLSAAYSAAREQALSSGQAGQTNSSSTDRQRPLGVPISSSGGQNVYQMMTLETTSGTVQLPVDVQAASRVADEKRRRNAGASARFRQRRKEKEKEASTTIGRLEQQVRELSEDLDFYKRERDYMAGVILQVPGGDRHFPRPQSPRHRRSSGVPSAGYLELSEQDAHSPDDERNVRRRTSTLSIPPPPPPQVVPPILSAPGPSFPSSYQPQRYGQPLAPQPATPSLLHPHSESFPANRASLGSLPPYGPPQLLQALPQTGQWNPFTERHSQGQHRDSR